MLVELLVFFLLFISVTHVKCANNKSKKLKRKNRRKPNERSGGQIKKVDKESKKSVNKVSEAPFDSKRTSGTRKTDEEGKEKTVGNSAPGAPGPTNISNNNIEKPIEPPKEPIQQAPPPVKIETNEKKAENDKANSKIQKILQGETRDPNEYPTLADAGDVFDNNATIEQNNVNIGKKIV
uniref:Uncharacterized protein n=1 Tax=Parastrongyloides trichosuri TaxID=131310 RepID=A0A0N4ZT91_PARTI